MKMQKAPIGMLFVTVLVGGALMGYVALKLPMPLAVVCCTFGAFGSMFVGMIMYAVIVKSNTDLTVNAAIHEMKLNLSNVLIQQKNAYLELMKASSRLIARRVAERTVTEMLHGLDNDEQRDAALQQMNSIVDEELDTLHRAIELTGKKSDA